MDRRSFFKILTGLLLSSKLKGFGKSSLFEIGIMKHSGGAEIRGSGLKKVLWEVVKRTSIEVSFDLPLIPLTNNIKLFKHPFLYLTGDSPFELTVKEIEVLKSYLDFGGFLFIDSAEGVLNGSFYNSVYKMITKLYTKKRLEILPKNHVVYRSFNMLDKPYGRYLLDPDFYGIQNRGRVEILYNHNDIMGACAKDMLGNWEYPVANGDRQRELAFRTAINIIMYATCLDYKTDQVHIEYLLNNRR